MRRKSLPNRPGIYVIWIGQNKNKIYIGSAVNISLRRNKHINDLEKNRHHNQIIQNNWNKYGKKFLRFEVLELINTTDILINREQYWIDHMVETHGRKFVANHCLIAGNLLGYKLTPEHKKNISQSLKGRTLSEKTKRKISESAKNRSISIETRKKLRTYPFDEGITI